MAALASTILSQWLNGRNQYHHLAGVMYINEATMAISSIMAWLANQCQNGIQLASSAFIGSVIVVNVASQ